MSSHNMKSFLNLLKLWTNLCKKKFYVVKNILKSYACLLAFYQAEDIKISNFAALLNLI